MGNLVNKIFSKQEEIKTENEYMTDISYFQKKCWRFNMNEEAIFKETRRYINKLKLTEDKHPFLTGFRVDLNDMYKNEGYNRERYTKLFNEFYRYKNKLSGIQI